MTDYAPYWIIIGASPSQRPYRHESESLANQEAERLALRHPGTVFTVLKAERIFVHNAVTRRELNGGKHDDDIPF